MTDPYPVLGDPLLHDALLRFILRRQKALKLLSLFSGLNFLLLIWLVPFTRGKGEDFLTAEELAITINLIPRLAVKWSGYRLPSVVDTLAHNHGLQQAALFLSCTRGSQARAANLVRIPDSQAPAAISGPQPSGGTGAGKDEVTVIGYGSLLSEKSARSTFPSLTGFTFARVHGYRRVFRHPAPIFFERNIVPEGTLEFSSLSVEPCDGRSIVVAIMKIHKADWDALVRREEEYDLVQTSYTHLDSTNSSNAAGKGFMAVPLTSDEAFISRWGLAHFREAYGKHGIKTIWGWGPDSGILPCPVYLRHCTLSAEKAEPEVLRSFLDDTVLVDRATSIREYLASRPDIMQTLPPSSLLERYNG